MPLAAAGALTALTLAACGSSGSSGSNTASSISSAPAPAPAATSGSPTAAHNAADVNFAELMIPHHQQAIEMATLAGTRAANGQVKTIAERVRAAQGPEITTMTGWLTSWDQPTAVPSTTARPMGSTSGMGGSPSPGMGGTTSPYGMMSDAEMGMLQGLTGSAFDREFLTMMIGHHQGAIALARTEKAAGQYRPATDLARSIETSQTGEVTEIRPCSRRSDGRLRTPPRGASRDASGVRRAARRPASCRDVRRGVDTAALQTAHGMSEKAPAEYLVRQASSRVPRPPGQQPSPCRRGRDEGFHRGPPSHRRTVEVLLIASLYVEASSWGWALPRRLAVTLVVRLG